MNVLAIDVDLRRIHAWSSENGQVCYKAPTIDELSFMGYTTVLMEVAGSSSVMRANMTGTGPMHNLAKWMIFNAMIAGEIFTQIERMSIMHRPAFLVAPSAAWTRGYPEKVRHKLAGATAKNHDLRETQSMLWFHHAFPRAWLPYRKYQESL